MRQEVVSSMLYCLAMWSVTSFVHLISHIQQKKTNHICTYLQLELVHSKITNYHWCRVLFQLACLSFSQGCVLFVPIWLLVRRKGQNIDETQMFMKFFDALVSHLSLMQTSLRQSHLMSKCVFVYPLDWKNYIRKPNISVEGAFNLKINTLSAVRKIKKQTKGMCLIWLLLASIGYTASGGFLGIHVLWMNILAHWLVALW